MTELKYEDHGRNRALIRTWIVIINRNYDSFVKILGRYIRTMRWQMGIKIDGESYFPQTHTHK